MKKDLAKILYCFPNLSDSKKLNSESYSEAVLKEMHDNKSVDYNGYLTDEDVKTDLSKRVGVLTAENYVIPDHTFKIKLNNIIEKAMSLAFEKLPHPETPVYIFIFPWIPAEADQKSFHGVSGVTRHARVMQLFINTSDYSVPHVKRSVIHEYNHLVYFYKHFENSYTLRDHLLVEGLAMLFREEVIGGAKSPWIEALSKEKSLTLYSKLGNRLDSTSYEDYKNLFFGNTEYKRWSGYSIGYYLIKEFRMNHPNMSWAELMQLTGKDL